MLPIKNPFQTINRLMALDALAFPVPWTHSDFLNVEEATTSRGGMSLVLFDDSQNPVGFVVVSVLDGGATIDRIGVAHHAQRQGIGGKLLTEAERFAKEAGAGRMDLHVDTENSAVKFYIHVGYEVIAKVPGYYIREGREGRDALLMSKPLPAKRKR